MAVRLHLLRLLDLDRSDPPEADRDVLGRLERNSFIYFLGFLAFTFLSPLRHDMPVLALAFGVTLFALGAVRLGAIKAHRRSPQTEERRAARIVRVCIVAQATT